MQEKKRMYRSRRESMIAGVAGGIAEYFDTDPTLVRVIWLIALCFGGAGLLFYILAWIVMPLNPEGPYNPRMEKTEQWRETVIQTARDVEAKLKANGGEQKESPAGEYTAQWQPVGGGGASRSAGARAALTLGWFLVVIGIILLLLKLSPINVFRIVWMYWPIALVLLGALFVVQGVRR